MIYRDDHVAMSHQYRKRPKWRATASCSLNSQIISEGFLLQSVLLRHLLFVMLVAIISNDLKNALITCVTM